MHPNQIIQIWQLLEEGNKEVIQQLFDVNDQESIDAIKAQIKVPYVGITI